MLFNRLLLLVFSEQDRSGVPGSCKYIVSTVLNKVQQLPDHPESGRTVPEFDQPQIRELVYPPFRIPGETKAKAVFQMYRKGPEIPWAQP